MFDAKTEKYKEKEIHYHRSVRDDVHSPSADVRPVMSDVRFRQAGNGDIIQRARVGNPSGVGTMTIDTLQKLNEYYDILASFDHGNDMEYRHIEYSDCFKAGDAITGDEVDQVIAEMSIVSGNRDKDLESILGKLEELHSLGEQESEKPGTKTETGGKMTVPKPHKVKGKDGEFYGEESEWHIHDVGGTSHLRYRTGKRYNLNCRSQIVKAIETLKNSSFQNGAAECLSVLQERLKNIL